MTTKVSDGFCREGNPYRDTPKFVRLGDDTSSQTGGTVSMRALFACSLLTNTGSSVDDFRCVDSHKWNFPSRLFQKAEGPILWYKKEVLFYVTSKKLQGSTRLGVS